MCLILCLLPFVLLGASAEDTEPTTLNYDEDWKPLEGFDQISSSSTRRTKDFPVLGSNLEESFHNRRSSNSKRFQNDRDEDGRPYNANLLNQFLEEYAEKVKRTNATTRRKVVDQEVSLDESTGSSDKLNLKNGYIWDMVHTDKNRRPQHNNKGGWVTMDAVPWSTSKISKWQSKPSHDHDFPNIDRFSTSSNQHNTYYDTPKPIKGTHNRPGGSVNRRPISNIVTRPDFDYDDQHSPPSYNRPYDQDRPELEYDADMPSRPYYPKPSKPCDQDHKYGYNSDIVTDGLPGNFPPYRGPSTYDYPSSTSRLSSRHPSTYPGQANGEWVLISASKGYPSHHRATGRRSMVLSAPEDNSADETQTTAVTSTKGIKLTVLPPKDISNMTTSHGGMLEVESSHQTVDDSQRLFHKDQLAKNATRRGIKRRPLLQGRPLQMGNAAPDSSAVLAAVGAGMVPATMAMAIPLLMGKKRRRRSYSRYPIPLSNVRTWKNNWTENVIQRSIQKERTRF